VSYPAIPVAVVIAVLRYRLYEIDRLVSRSLGWALATATIVAVFVGAVLALQAALSGVTQSGTLAVAVSTLLAFALFQPVRRRVQALVDRRFDRPRLEAERILAGHGERLRQETDLERIETGVLDTVSDTLRPTSASVWIRHARAHGP
jgi:divalent metal cation (Fe/Co/Zn/Cd) transporter